MVAWIMLSIHSEPHHKSRKAWSRTKAVQPKHYVGGFHNHLFRLYQRRKQWKGYKARRRTYLLRGYMT